MISQEHQFIFVHIPKTAGTSIANALGGDFLPYSAGTEWDAFGLEKHATLGDIQKKLPSNIFTSYFKFCFVRNPFDQLLSHYNHRLRTKQMPAGFEEPWEFSRFIGFLYETNRSVDRYSQKAFICSKTSLNGMDFIGRFESLETDFQEVCKRLNLGKLLLPRLNQNSHPYYRECYEPTTKRLAQSLLEEDLEAFGYDF